MDSVESYQVPRRTVFEAPSPIEEVDAALRASVEASRAQVTQEQVAVSGTRRAVETPPTPPAVLAARALETSMMARW